MDLLISHTSYFGHVSFPPCLQRTKTEHRPTYTGLISYQWFHLTPFDPSVYFYCLVSTENIFIG